MKSERKRRVYYDPCQEKVVRTIPCYEKKGVAYCEHYPEGLPVCSKCREESTLAHDKACALLAEARAEIERLNAPVLSAPLLRETLAELAHNQWAGWMEYLFFKSKQVDGCVIVPAWANERWRRQVATRYADLSEEEKDSDRSEADKFLAVFNAQLAERDNLIEQMRGALHLADDLIDEYAADYEHRDNVDEVRDEIKAALSAAERGE